YLVLAYTDNGNILISKSLKIEDKIQPSSKICPEIGDTRISEDGTITSNKTYFQISMREAEAILVIIGVLESSLIALLLLALLIIFTA
ncbi:10945_t:CDS:1, partial [Cetraspora pellucida]